MSSFSGDIGREAEDGGGWGGLMPSPEEREDEARRFNRTVLPVGVSPAASPAPEEPDRDWKAMAFDCLNALRLLNQHYDDLSKSNPGFMGRLCLQRYDLWNESLIASARTLKKYADVEEGRR